MTEDLYTKPRRFGSEQYAYCGRFVAYRPSASYG